MTRTQLRVETILIDLDPGECEGDGCTWSGCVDAVLDPHDGTAEFRCEGCGTYGTRTIFEDD
jgi:hypothetical protein